MKIAVVTGSLSRQAGGFYYSVRRLAIELSRRNHEIDAFGLLDSDFGRDRASWNPVGTHALKHIGPARLAFAPAMRASLRQYAPDLVHLNGLWMMLSASCNRWHRETGRPYIVSPRGMLNIWALRHSRWKKDLASILYENRNLRNATCLHALSQQGVEDCRAHGLTNPIALIPNGVDLPQTPRDPLTPPWHGVVPKEAKVLLFMGRLHSKKGIYELVDGWQKTDRQRKGWRVVIAGWDDGGEKLLRDQIQRLQLTDEVILIGPQYGREKEACLGRADAFILPSYSEGLPISVLEAWANKLPVLATSHCNLPIGFEKGAAISIKPEADSIAGGLEKLFAMTDAERTQMGDNGESLVASTFAWSTVAAQMESIYNWMLGAAPMPTCVQTYERNVAKSIKKVCRTAFLTGSLSRQGGGFFPILQRMSSALIEQGVEVEVFGRLDQDYPQDRESWKEVCTHPFRTRGPERLAYAPGLKEALQRHDPEIIHLHGLWMIISKSCHQWHQQTKRPYIISSHGMMDSWALHHAGWKKRIAACLYENRNLRDAACLHALSEHEVRQYRDYGLRNPIALISNGIDIPSCATETMLPPWKNLFSDESKVLLFLGRLHPKKGILELLEGWKRSGHRRDEWKLVIGGWDDGGYQAVILKRLAALHLSQEVFLLGPQFGAMKDACFRTANAFILSSHSEGLPVGVLEAWSYGLPVVMTPACNLPIGFERAAAIPIEPQADSIAAGLEKLFAMSDVERIHMGSNGRQLVEKSFSWSTIAAQMKSVYQWMLGQGAKPDCVNLG